MTRPIDRWVRVGVVGRPHGLHGAVYAHLDNAESALLAEGSRLRLGEGEGAMEATVSRSRWAVGGWLVELEGVGQREAAAALTNRKLYVHRSDLPPLEDGEFYQDDVVGFRVLDTSGRALGTIAGFFDNGAHEVCVVRTASGDDVLLPFYEGLIEDVRIEDEVVVLEVPEGIPGLDEEASEADAEP